MVSESEMSTEGGSTEEEQSVAGEETSYGAEQAETTQESVVAEPAKAKPKARITGRRAALRILRENVDSLSKDLSGFRKTHEVSSKKLEKQVTSIRGEVAALKSYFSKETARATSKQESYLKKILAKVNAPKPKSQPKKKAKKSKGKK